MNKSKAFCASSLVSACQILWIVALAFGCDSLGRQLRIFIVLCCQQRASAKLVIDRPHHIAEPKRQARLLTAITRINVQFFRTWGFANNFLKIGIFGGGKQLLPSRRPIGSELFHQLPCRTLDNLNLAIVMGDTHMAEDFCRTFLPVRTDSTIWTRVRLS